MCRVKRGIHVHVVNIVISMDTVSQMLVIKIFFFHWIVNILTKSLCESNK